jgi:phospholipid-translocating ATPase
MEEATAADREPGPGEGQGKPGLLKTTTPAQTFRHGAYKVYKRVFLEFILREKPLPPSKDGRHIPVETRRQKPLTDERRGHAYINNSIRTSRYTVYDFIPKQLIFQFSRIGNFYFLCVGVPQMVPGLSTTGNYTTILPLMFFVMLTMVKEGYDDYKRHRLDMVENANAAMVLKQADAHAHTTYVRERQSPIPFHTKKIWKPPREFDEEFDGLKWIPTKWSDLSVGDVIKLERDEPVPADIVLLHTEGENNLAYIETMALDGETNLKSKQVSDAIKDCGTIEGLTKCSARFVTEDPNPDLYKFDGRVTVGDETLPLTLNEVIYRGSILRNTRSVIGLVVNTGEECKIRM